MTLFIYKSQFQYVSHGMHDADLFQEDETVDIRSSMEEEEEEGAGLQGQGRQDERTNER